jgi:hypothetical protein
MRDLPKCSTFDETIYSGFLHAATHLDHRYDAFSVVLECFDVPD